MPTRLTPNPALNRMAIGGIRLGAASVADHRLAEFVRGQNDQFAHANLLDSVKCVIFYCGGSLFCL